MKYLVLAILAITFSTSVMAAEVMTGYELRLGINTRDGHGYQPEKNVFLSTHFGLEIWDTNASEVNFQQQELKIGLARPICTSPEARIVLGAYWSEMSQQSVPDYDFLVIAGRVHGKIAGNNYNVRVEYYVPAHATVYNYYSSHMLRLTDMFIERPVSKDLRIGLTGEYHHYYERRVESVLLGPRVSIDAGKNATLNVSYLNWGKLSYLSWSKYEPHQLQTELICRF